MDKGNERETFFYNQLHVGNEIKYPKQGDFYVNEQYLFEVGGKRKSFEQIKDYPDSFLAVDDTEVGYATEFPYGFSDSCISRVCLIIIRPAV